MALPVAFPPEHPDVTLSAVVGSHGARQLHVAETEKYPHVTYFFNGGEEKACEGERRELVPSPRDVPTYDHKPEMSAREAADAFVEAWETDSPTFGIINFANADMVGHTGVIEAGSRGSRQSTSAWGRWSAPYTIQAAPA
jgi:2,3-bisphosphoglycerate-independent phosphoglycerate mutase